MAEQVETYGHQSRPGATRLLVLPGDGIGPEIVAATVDVLREADRIFGLDLIYETAEIGFDSLKAVGTTITDEVVAQAERADGVILGPVSHNEYPPVAEGGLNPSGELRKRLDLFANIRPARSRAGLPPRCGRDIDLVIVRENTEGFYADRSMYTGPGEFMPTPDIALSVRKITRTGSERIVETAFSLAARRRRKVALVHKANVLRLSDGFFLECARQVAARHPDIAYEERLVDAVAALLIRDPGQFDVIVTTNMFGDILSDEASEIAGSLGIGASLNAGDRFAVAQAQHGSAPDIAGRDLANPTSLIESIAMLLAWLEQRGRGENFAAASRRIMNALDAVIAVPNHRTRDLSGRLGTQAFTAHVIARLADAV
ncbi:MAG TPA: isocitrate/isopropylmalate dehydrogenase family protein [Xanthobacteraceae bacterium]|nr:isocitrate/isopropylmalate dehydrogenase family protein [Xanthobacteraceae bacterium]